VGLFHRGILFLPKKFAWREGSEDNSGVLRSAARRVTEFYDGFLKPSGLTTSQLSLLLRVSEAEEASINSIATRINANRTTVARCLQALDAAGFIRMQRSKKDKRVQTPVITARGFEAMKAAAPLWRQAQAAFDVANGESFGRDLRTTLAGIKFPAD
jgi:DNA-binding MarR family transcriptional regulator